MYSFVKRLPKYFLKTVTGVNFQNTAIGNRQTFPDNCHSYSHTRPGLGRDILNFLKMRYLGCVLSRELSHYHTIGWIIQSVKFLKNGLLKVNFERGQFVSFCFRWLCARKVSICPVFTSSPKLRWKRSLWRFCFLCLSLYWWLPVLWPKNCPWEKKMVRGKLYI